MFLFCTPLLLSTTAKMASPPFLTAIDLASYTSPSSVPAYLNYAGGLFATISAQNLDNALALLRDTAGSHTVYLEVTNIQSQNELIDLLDAGAAKIFISSDQASGIDKAPNIDVSRIVYCPTGAPGDTTTALEGTSFGLFLRNVASAEAVGAILHELGKKRPDVFVSKSEMNEDEAVELARQGAIPIVSARQLSVEGEEEEGRVRIASLLLAQAKSDRPDELFTTLVTDERGIALGLVYSNEESVAESLRCGRGVYHSRKRGL